MRFVTGFLQKEQCMEGTRHEPTQYELGGGDFLAGNTEVHQGDRSFFRRKTEVSPREYWRFLRVEDTQIF